MKNLFFLFCLFFSGTAMAAEPIRIGSKKFTESYLLAEIMAQRIEKETAIPVELKFGLEGTTVCFEALKTVSRIFRNGAECSSQNREPFGF